MKRRYLFYVICLSLMIAFPIAWVIWYPLPTWGEPPIHIASPVLLVEAILLIILVKYPIKIEEIKKVIPIILFFLLLSLIIFLSYFTAKGEDYRLMQVEAKMHDDIVDVVAVGDDEINIIIYDPMLGIHYNFSDVWREEIEEAFDKLSMTFGLQFCFAGWIFLDLPELYSLEAIHNWAKQQVHWGFHNTTYSTYPYVIDMLIVINHANDPLVGNDYGGLSDRIASIIVANWAPHHPYVIMHEIGHLFHLVSRYGPGEIHCRNKYICVMSTILDVYPPVEFCSECINEFNTNGYAHKFDYDEVINFADVYIDGQLVDYTGPWFYVTVGTHTIFVNDCWDTKRCGIRYCFNLNKEITIDKDTKITTSFQKKYCPGDVDGNGIVYIDDAVRLIRHWGSTRHLGDTLTEWDSRTDLNADGIVNILDAIILSVNYGKTGDPPVGESNESLNPVYASPTALSVEPSLIVDPQYGSGTWFTVNVTVTDVTDLFGYEFKLKYNTTLLDATSITLGPVFPQQIGGVPTGPTIIWKNEINDASGYAWYAVSLGDYAPTYPYGIDVYGTETLATINFTVTGSGESILDLVDTVLCDSEGNAIAYEVHIGLFSNVEDLAQPIADLADWKAMPEHKNFDQSKELEKGEDLINALYAEVQNLGNTTVRVKVRFTISDEYGVPVAAFETSTYTFAYGTYLSIYIFDTSKDVIPPEFDTSTWGTGTFYVEAQSFYYDYVLKDWVGGKIKTFSFTVTL